MPFFRLFKPRAILPPPRMRLAVFATEETLPWPLQLAHPAKLWGALPGIPVVMRQCQDPRRLLEQPMEPGDYLFEGISATVVACVQERQGGEPYPGRDAADGVRLSGLGRAERERLERARWVVALQLTEVLNEPRDAVLFLVELADRLANLAEGVVLDQESRRYYLPGKWRVANAVKPLDAREQVAIHLEKSEGDRMWVHTHGLSKFGRPELELLDLPSELGEAACRLLVDLSQQMIGGAVLRPGERVGDPQSPLILRLGTIRSEAHYGGPSLELADPAREGEPGEKGGARGVAAYHRAWSDRRAV